MIAAAFGGIKPNWTMIARRYGRWTPSAGQQAGEKATALFAKKMLSECCLSDQK
ncbi:hypothetical protein [Mycoavidus sp. SF9855]|uniref:hypothetical protein n=1 Tax=Mycoavidus sp. SF9855 TaxID=2968475 RepID=UPI00211CADE4|nr:hypothetical protein [Mycoavidus sp. SF9855]UUM21166.1 hypothetical protein NQD60_06860 [Mycoavidus sp. SF9855]